MKNINGYEMPIEKEFTPDYGKLDRIEQLMYELAGMTNDNGEFVQSVSIRQSTIGIFVQATVKKSILIRKR